MSSKKLLRASPKEAQEIYQRLQALAQALEAFVVLPSAEAMRQARSGDEIIEATHRAQADRVARQLAAIVHAFQLAEIRGMLSENIERGMAIASDLDSVRFEINRLRSGVDSAVLVARENARAIAKRYYEALKALSAGDEVTRLLLQQIAREFGEGGDDNKSGPGGSS